MVVYRLFQMWRQRRHQIIFSRKAVDCATDVAAIAASLESPPAHPNQKPTTAALSRAARTREAPIAIDSAKSLSHRARLGTAAARQRRARPGRTTNNAALLLALQSEAPPYGSRVRVARGRRSTCRRQPE